MYQRIRRQFSPTAIVLSVLAIVLALTGAAFAAGGFSGKQKKEIEKIAKKFAGKPGAPGANGQNGAAGERGPQGEPGKAGTNGKSVTVGSFTGAEEEAGEPAGEPCKKRGGTEVEVEGSGNVSYVCNGQTGFTSTLPSGKTETGVWETPITEFTAEGEHREFQVPVSLPIPLPERINHEHVEAVAEATPTANCPGTAEEPAAEPGYFCLYVGEGGERNVNNYGRLRDEAESIEVPPSTLPLLAFLGYVTRDPATYGANEPSLEKTTGIGPSGSEVLIYEKLECSEEQKNSGAGCAPRSFNTFGTWAVTAP